MWFYISIWLLLGVVGLLISRLVTFKVERILGYPVRFFDKRFIKLNSHRIFYGPFYLLATLWDFFLNLDVFEKAKMVKEQQDLQRKNLERLTSTLQILGQQMTSMQSFMTLFGPRQESDLDEESFEEFETDVRDSGDPLKDVEDMLSDFDEDEEV